MLVTPKTPTCFDCPTLPLVPRIEAEKSSLAPIFAFPVIASALALISNGKWLPEAVNPNNIP